MKSKLQALTFAAITFVCSKLWSILQKTILLGNHGKIGFLVCDFAPYNISKSLLPHFMLELCVCPHVPISHDLV